MSASYNLRSSHKRTRSTIKCYLQNLVERKSVDPKTSPAVCMQRLKVLENPDSYNYSYYVHKNKIQVIKPNIEKKNIGKSYKIKTFLKCTCLILLFVSSFTYFKGDIKHYGSVFKEEVSHLYKKFCQYYCDEYCTIYPNIQFCKTSLNLTKTPVKDKLLNKTIKNIMDEIVCKSNVTALDTHLENFNDKFYIQKIVKDQIVENEKNSKNTFSSFIEEQCKREFKPKQADNLKESSSKFYNFQSGNVIDYALESKGAKILATFDSELYGAVAMKFWNYDFGTIKNNFFQKYFYPKGPSLILVPWKKPGDCWAFKGSYSRVQIKLSQKIIITGITIDHITKELSANGNIDSAPRKFSVVGIENADHLSNRVYLGTFEYSNTGPAVQMFSIKPDVGSYCEVLELTIESNHGNKDYTCLYKVGVHGYQFELIHW